MTLGLLVFVQLVMAAMTTEPLPSSNDSPRWVEVAWAASSSGVAITPLGFFLA